MPGRMGTICLSVGICLSVVNASEAAGAYAIGKRFQSSWGGGASNAANYSDAGREALDRCSKFGPECAVVAYFSRKCFSLAIPPGTGAYYWVTRNTIDEARATVLDHCLASGRICEVKVAFCDARGLPAALPSESLQAIPGSASLGRGLERRAISDEHLPINGQLVLFLAVSLLVLIGVAIAVRKQSFRLESGYSAHAAERYDNEAARFRAMGRKLDAEAELAESLIKAKRKQAELDDIEDMFRD